MIQKQLWPNIQKFSEWIEISDVVEMGKTTYETGTDFENCWGIPVTSKFIIFRRYCFMKYLIFSLESSKL